MKGRLTVRLESEEVLSIKKMIAGFVSPVLQITELNWTVLPINFI